VSSVRFPVQGEEEGGVVDVENGEEDGGEGEEEEDDFPPIFKTKPSTVPGFRRRAYGRNRHRSIDYGENYPGVTEEPGESFLFGTKPWRIVAGQSLDPVTASLFEPLNKPKPVRADSLFNIGNMLWVLLFGWILAIVYTIAAALLYATVVGRPYADVCWALKSYFLWPFGKYIVSKRSGTAGGATKYQKELSDESTDRNFWEGKSIWDLLRSCCRFKPITLHPDQVAQQEYPQHEEDPALAAAPSASADADSNMTAHTSLLHRATRKPLTVQGAVAYFFWILVGMLFVNLFHLLVFIFCWMSILFIPMAKVNLSAMWFIVGGGFCDLKVVTSGKMPTQHIRLCTYQALNANYFRYSVFGLNVVLVNLLPFVVITLIIGYVLPEKLRPHPLVLFVTSLLSITPIAYYIGMAVASIAQQTNYAVGAMLNAIFGVSIEIILYCSALWQGGLIELVRAGVFGWLWAYVIDF
jgi:Ca2+:H+ antiporter